MRRNSASSAKPMPRVDTPGKRDGTAVFGIDVRVPGMLFAVIARCPHFGGKLASCDDLLRRLVPGVGEFSRCRPSATCRQSEPQPECRGWHGRGGRLHLGRDTGSKGAQDHLGQRTRRTREHRQFARAFREQAAGPPTVVAVDRGDAREGPGERAERVEAEYELPFQAHATMEPMNTTAHVRGDGTIEVWTPTQIAEHRRTEIAAAFGHAAGEGHRSHDVIRRILRPPLSMGLRSPKRGRWPRK